MRSVTAKVSVVVKLCDRAADQGVNEMAKMSPLAALILRAIRAGSIAAAGFVVLVILIELWKRWRFGGFGGMAPPDFAFMGVLAAMLIGFVWLIRSITREIARDRQEP